MAIDILKLGMTMGILDRNIVSQFLKSDSPALMGYPDVAAMIAEWIGKGKWGDMDELVKDTWALTEGSINNVDFMNEKDYPDSDRRNCYCDL